MKKNIFLMIMLAVFGLVNAQEQERLNLLRELQSGKVLYRSEYSQDAVQAINDIQNDLDLLQKDTDNALRMQKSAEGFFYSGVIPGIPGLIKVGSGLMSSIGIVASTISSYLAYNVWTQPIDMASKVYLGGTDLYYGRSWKAVEEKLRFLLDYAPNKEYNAQVLAAAVVVPLITLASFVTYKCAAKVYRNYCEKNTSFIASMKNKQDANRLVVAELNNIKNQIEQAPF